MQPKNKQQDSLSVREVGRLAEYGAMFVGNDLLLATTSWYQLRLYDRSLQPVASLHHERKVNLDLTTADPQGHSLVTVSQQFGGVPSVRLWRWAAGRAENVVLPHPHGVTAVAYNAAGDRIATGDDTGRVMVWDEAGQLLYTLRHRQPVFRLAWQPTAPGQLLVLTGDQPTQEQQLHLWHKRTHAASFNPCPGLHTDLKWAADGQSFVSYSRDRYEVWSVAGELLLTASTDPLADDNYSHLTPLAGGRLLIGDAVGRLTVRFSGGSLPLADFGASLGNTDQRATVMSTFSNEAGSRLVVTSTGQHPYLWNWRRQSGAYLPHFDNPGTYRLGLVEVDVAINPAANLIAAASWGEADSLSYTKLWAVADDAEREPAT